jgi:hypothetical protein
MSDLACVEGEDIPDDDGAREPIQLHITGGLVKRFSHDVTTSAWGPRPFEAMAERLRYEDYGPRHPVEIIKDGECIGRTTLEALARFNQEKPNT